jgi:hypothetical protein
MSTREVAVLTRVDTRHFASGLGRIFDDLHGRPLRPLCPPARWRSDMTARQYRAARRRYARQMRAWTKETA